MARLRGEAGFGLVELLIAMVFLSVAIMLLVASFSSATIAINRASRVSTGGVIADSQMERFRSMTYVWIGLDLTAATDGTYTSDMACIGGAGAGCSNIQPTTGATAATDCRPGGVIYTSFPQNCVPTQPVTGPDGRAYRVDTYVRSIQTVSTRSTKLVTIVVRDPAAANRLLAREESDFDYCTALQDPNPYGLGPCT